MDVILYGAKLYLDRRLKIFIHIIACISSMPLLIKHIDTLRAAFKYVKERYPFTINAMVVLPDHLHCIWTLPEDDCDYAKRWALIKIYFSKKLPKTERINTSRAQKGERGIWQRRFWEHVIRDECDYLNHIKYIHINPIKHGL